MRHDLEQLPPTVDQPQNAQWIATLRRGAYHRVKTAQEARELAAICETLRRPATETWLRQRVGTLLAMFFTSPLPEVMVRAISDDWVAVLTSDGMPPEWAVTNACRWWVGPQNENRRNRPMPGDIAAQIKSELGVVAVTEGRVRRFGQAQQEERQGPSPEMAARMAKAGNAALKAMAARSGEGVGNGP